MKIEIPREPEAPNLSEREIREITGVVFREPGPKKADLIFVFGYGPGHTEDNWKEVAKLFKEGYADRVLVNGLFDIHAPRPDQPISHLIRDYLIRFGVPKEKILLQDKSRNTLEDVLFGKQLLELNEIFPKSIIYVAKAHHSGRCYLTLKKYFPDVELFTYTFNAKYGKDMVTMQDWWKYPVARSRVYGEYLRIKEYSEKRDICKP